MSVLRYLPTYNYIYGSSNKAGTTEMIAYGSCMFHMLIEMSQTYCILEGNSTSRETQLSHREPSGVHILKDCDGGGGTLRLLMPGKVMTVLWAIP